MPITIHNITNIPQPAYVGERRVMLEAYEVRDVTDEIANAFLAQRPKQVQVHKPVVVPIRHGEEVRWIANVTGNPFLPKKLTRFQLEPKTGIEKPYEVPNPLCEPLMVSRTMNVDEEIRPAQQGNFKESFASPPITVKIPPYTRYPFPISISDWMLRRDSQMDENFVGKIAACRPPSSFEPNETWPHAEILVYAQMVDPRTHWASMFKPGKHNDPEDVSSKKAELLHALFFRIVDEQYALPPEPAFQAQLARLKEEMKQAKLQQEKQPQAQAVAQ